MVTGPEKLAGIVGRQTAEVGAVFGLQPVVTQVPDKINIHLRMRCNDRKKKKKFNDPHPLTD